MKKLFISFVTVAALVITSVAGCKKETSPPPDTSSEISFAVPPGWPQPYYTFPNNTLTQQGFELGRKLFYDVRLSRDNTISCASCHAQFAAFSHLEHPLSHGIDGLFGTRNAPGIFNMAWKPAYFWDGGITNLESQPQIPIEHPVEMDLNINDAVNRLNADAAYRDQFKKAFGSDIITAQNLFKALAQFMAAMVSSNSRYDKYTRGNAGGILTSQELSGLNTFREKCGSCHKEPLFTDNSFRSNGLPVDVSLNDSGRAHITGLAADKYKFMVPSLRNADLTRPYMHDGRFNSLDAVLEHYRTGVYAATNPDPTMANGISMTEEEKTNIIAFLKTLTDTIFTKDKRFSEPGM